MNKYFLHNIIGHPLMAIAGLFSKDLGIWFHDITLPEKESKNG